MSDFVNTVDTLGDAALSDSFIDRSISALSDSYLTAIGSQAFRGCKALASVNFQNVVNVGTAAFWECTGLEKAEFHSCVALGVNAFYGCSKLKKLYLYNKDAVSTCTSSLSGTAIANGTGYIYVPGALLDAYKAASGWSAYADRIVAFETAEWVELFASIDAGTYATDYALGDTIPLDLGSKGIVNMQIVGFDVDDKADGSGKAPITWISKEVLENRRMNPTIENNYSYPEKPSWEETSSGVWQTQNRYVVSDAVATWKITSDSLKSQMVTVTYKVSGSSANNKLGIAQDGTPVITDYGSTSEASFSTALPAGGTIEFSATYSLLSEKNYYGQITFTSTGAFTTEATIQNAPTRVSDGYKEGTGSIGGWEKCEMRTYLQGTIKPLIPQTVRSRIVTVTKNQRSNNSSITGVAQTTVDEVWIPSVYEILGMTSTGETAGMVTYAWFQENAERCIKQLAGANELWYLRTAQEGSRYCFYCINTDGTRGNLFGNQAYGIALGFCT